MTLGQPQAALVIRTMKIFSKLPAIKLLSRELKSRRLSFIVAYILTQYKAVYSLHSFSVAVKKCHDQDNLWEKLKFQTVSPGPLWLKAQQQEKGLVLER